MAKKKRKPFAESAIVPQKFRFGLPEGPLGTHYTKSGKQYGTEYQKVKSYLDRHYRTKQTMSGVKPLLSKARIDTIMAFCRNYYIKHAELPKIEQLKKLFKF